MNVDPTRPLPAQPGPAESHPESAPPVPATPPEAAPTMPAAPPEAALSTQPPSAVFEPTAPVTLPIQAPAYPPAGVPGPMPLAGTPGLMAPSQPVVVQIAEIAVTSSVARTPAGDIPLAGSTWHVTDYWQTEQKIPTWAIVLAVVGFCVLTVFSLLFLLIKETIHRGTVQVTVSNGAHQYVARIPVTNQAQVHHIHQQVNYVRSLAAL